MCLLGSYVNIHSSMDYVHFNDFIEQFNAKKNVEFVHVLA